MRASSLLIVPSLILMLAPRAAADAGLGAAQRRAAVEGLAGTLRARYVLPEVATRAADSLLAKLAAGGYPQTRAEALAQALARDLQELTRDRHFRVFFDPEFRGPASPEPAAPAAEEQASYRRAFARHNFGVSKAEVLPGNVGLLDLRFFAPEEISAPTLAGAMAVLANTDALIVDVRQNGGGHPDAIAFLCSYFFPEGSRVHLNDIHDRVKNQTQQFWTRPAVPGARYAGKPVYVLISAGTFSGGEELGYDLQAQGRATLVGESTSGDANRGRSVEVGGGFVAFIPSGRAINPVTRTSWEGVGVQPDVAAPAAEALKVAHLAALRTILQAATDEDHRRSLAHTLAMLKRGKPERFLYRPWR
jgi:hypothetical protein